MAANLFSTPACVAYLALLIATSGCTKTPPTKPAYPNSWQVGYQLIGEREGWRSDDFFSAPKYLEICEAISYRNDAKLTELIKENVDLNVQGVNGFTLLYWAFVEQNLSAFNILLKHGANPDLALSQTIEGKHYSFIINDNILFTSLHCMRPQFCMAALPYSKDVNRRRGGKDNLLHAYFWHHGSSLKMLEALIEAGVDVNAVGSFGYTPCHYAASRKPEFCIPLIEAGSDPKIRNDEGQTVVEMLERERARLAAVIKPEAITIAEHDKVIVWLKERQSSSTKE